MKKTKEQKGITLVALIITIVVLLILAIVSIGAVSDSNIIAYAQNATQDYNTAKEEQEVLLREYETEIEKHLPNNNITKVGVKAYNFNGSIIIFTPENELYQYTKATDLFPSYKIDLVEVKIENDPTYDITIDTNDFTQEEISKMHLVTATGMNGICAYFDGEDGRDTFYFTPVASGVTEVTITKSMPIEHSEQLLAQYYQDPTKYEYYVDNDTRLWIFDYEKKEASLYLKKLDTNEYVYYAGTNFIKELNDAPLKVKINGEEHIITTSAYKITSNGLNIYIENGLMYYNGYGVREGSNVEVWQKIKFINLGLLSIE